MGLRGRKPKDWKGLINVSDTGCWLWTGMKDSKDGYGRIEYNGKKWQATHHVWMMNGFPAVPSGMVLMHSCDTPICVNPDHLKIGTYLDNNMDCIRKGRRSPRKKKPIPG